MSDQNKADDLPFLDDLPYTPAPGSKPDQPEALDTPAAPVAPDVPSPAERAAARPAPARQPAPPAPKAAPAPHPTGPGQRTAATKPAVATHPTPDPQAAQPGPTSKPAPAVAPAAPPEFEWHPPAPETDGKRAVIPPAVLASRMQRYSIYLIVAAFLLVGANYDALSLSAVLWFAAGLTAGFAILCAVAVVLLNAIAWNFDRLRDELRGGREVVDLRE